MPSVAQNLHAYNNTRRHRAPRIVRVYGAGPDTMVVVFDRDMDTKFLDAGTFFRIFLPDADIWSEFGSDDSSWLNERELLLQSPTNTGSYNGDELYVRYMKGNVAAQGRHHVLPHGERCDRVELS